MPAGTITALRAQASDTQRINVFIDGEFALGVSMSTLGKVGLYVGQTLTEEEFAHLSQAEQASKAYQAALRLLEARPRSSTEIRDRLRRKEFTPEAIAQTLVRLGELGLVDDAGFARYWVENRQSNRPRGPGALRDELRRKGIERDVIDDVLDDAALTGDPDESALALARGAFHKYASAPDKQSFTRRMGGFLQRRGFSFETIRPIIDQLWRERQETLSAEDEAQPDR